MSTERDREGNTKQQSSGPDSEFSTYWYHTKLEKGFQARDQKYIYLTVIKIPKAFEISMFEIKKASLYYVYKFYEI